MRPRSSQLPSMAACTSWPSLSCEELPPVIEAEAAMDDELLASDRLADRSTPWETRKTKDPPESLEKAVVRLDTCGMPVNDATGPDETGVVVGGASAGIATVKTVPCKLKMLGV